MADVMAGEKGWMQLDGDGMQSHLGSRIAPKELLKKLTKPNLAWQKRFKAYISPEHGGLCVLECKECKEVQSATNPARSLKRHSCHPQAARAPIDRLNAAQKEEAINTVVRLNGGKGNAAMTTEVCKELTELDLGEWPREMADAGEFLSKRDYTADPAQLQIVMPRSPTYSRAF